MYCTVCVIVRIPPPPPHLAVIQKVVHVGYLSHVNDV